MCVHCLFTLWYLLAQFICNVMWVNMEMGCTILHSYDIFKSGCLAWLNYNSGYYWTCRFLFWKADKNIGTLLDGGLSWSEKLQKSWKWKGFLCLWYGWCLYLSNSMHFKGIFCDLSGFFPFYYLQCLWSCYW